MTQQGIEQMLQTAARNQEQSGQVLERLTAVARSGAVYSEPVIAGDYTVITASEVSVALGFGYGMGGGTGQMPTNGAAEQGTTPTGTGAGGGGGGGGMATARPVAIVSVGPQGVEIKPVFDLTKIGVAVLAAVGGLLVLMGRISRAGRK
jgi:uncharacterized spore protein YtfJ